jgi:hypothetical protein
VAAAGLGPIPVGPMALGRPETERGGAGTVSACRWHGGTVTVPHPRCVSGRIQGRHDLSGWALKAHLEKPRIRGD